MPLCTLRYQDKLNRTVNAFQVQLVNRRRYRVSLLGCQAHHIKTANPTQKQCHITWIQGKELSEGFLKDNIMRKVPIPTEIAEKWGFAGQED
ncbi:hypothetical protein KIN20_007224 [Parelaphostrongylus tenuis]|uniref:Uncharacterized protein n=1 Tax=Parelaphostrongylus tenuis TaxID=148309 RepID=A0AAD5M655_PARTN|nr:hypothetical protein KIN20_007224 [Parelaphostrongylus tenuis]